MHEKPDPNFRPSLDRAIYLYSEFDEALFEKVIPEIQILRREPGKAITAYINSPGGDVAVLEAIMGHIKHKDFDGLKSRLITVASGEATSAAAMLLVMGDYALAYEHSVIHFHGVRYFNVPELTTEKASTHAKKLALKNREGALKCANEVVKRLAHRYSFLCHSFKRIRELEGRGNDTDVECFVAAISQHISNTAYNAARDALRETLQVAKLSAATIAKLKVSQKKRTQLEIDLEVLRALINHEAKQAKAMHGSLDDEAVSQLLSDYLLLRDYYFGGHRSAINWILDMYGPLFLSPEESEEFEDISDKEAQKVYVSEKVQPRLRPFWYFTVKLCRRLHEGENVLSAKDAYWLGLVDEVIGTSMQGYRSVLETHAAKLEPELTDDDPPNASEPLS